MTRRGLLEWLGLGGLLGVPRIAAAKGECRAIRTFVLANGWKCTIDEPEWLNREAITPQNALAWQPKREYTIITRIHR